MNTQNKSPHILNVSANLFGICFVVFTYLRANKLSPYTYLDELTAVSMFLFMISTTASFLSIRSTEKMGRIYEGIADYIFIAGMFTLFTTTMLIVFNAII